MNPSKHILEFCKAMLNHRHDAFKYFTTGGCFQFHLLLKAAYPDDNPLPYYNGDHVITEIAGHYYDITGDVQHEGYKIFTGEQIKSSRAHTWHLTMKENGY